MKRLIAPLAGALLLVVFLAAYVGVRVLRDMKVVRAALQEGVDDLDADDLENAGRSLENVQETLDGVAARMLRVVPLMGANLDAAAITVASAIPVVEQSAVLARQVDEAARSDGFLSDGRIRIERLRPLAPALEDQAIALKALAGQTHSALGGWLLPPVWDRIAELSSEAGDLGEDAAAAAEVLAAAPDLLGQDRPKRYVLLLQNNAEARGAGGILTGVGVLTAREGKLSLGDLRSVHDLRDHPPRKVAVPDDFRRRFATYKADTTLWLNATWSPDVPDVAAVGQALLEQTTGLQTDGAIVIDPRGVAALLSPDAAVELPGGRGSVEAAELAGFVYRDAYAMYRNEIRRRAVILEVGRRAVEEALSGGALRAEDLPRIGEAVAGGHIRFLPDDAGVAEALSRLGVTGELTAPAGWDEVTVVTQNFGSDNGQGTKLDAWTHREVVQECEVETDAAVCTTTTTLRNEAPENLSTYVAGDPYGVHTMLVETYIPQRAELIEVTKEDENPEVFREADEDRTAVGVFARLGAGETTTIEVFYRLPLDGGFRLRLTPQPLAVDASFEVRLWHPRSWHVVTPRDGFDPGPADLQLSGALVAPVEVEVGPDTRSGLPGAWASLQRFLSRPLF